MGFRASGYQILTRIIFNCEKKKMNNFYFYRNSKQLNSERCLTINKRNNRECAKYSVY